jgi:hypothetical protein
MKKAEFILAALYRYELGRRTKGTVDDSQSQSRRRCGGRRKAQPTPSPTPDNWAISKTYMCLVNLRAGRPPEDVEKSDLHAEVEVDPHEVLGCGPLQMDPFDFVVAAWLLSMRLLHAQEWTSSAFCC